MAVTDGITVAIYQTWSVDDTGEPKDLVETRRSMWTCQQHGMSFGEWSQVLAHLAAQHNIPAPTPSPPTGGHHDFVETSENLGMSLE